MKGIAYVGAMEVLDKTGILKDVRRVAGTSAGAMMAVMVALRYTAAEMKEVLWNIDFKEFMDSSKGIFRDINRLRKDFGWYKGDYFREQMAQIIKKKTGSGETTFADLEMLGKYPDLYLVGADLTTGLSKMFSAKNQDTKNVKIADAARISMSIPLFYAAVRGGKNNKHVYVDGGLLDNYSIKTFDRQNYLIDANNARRTDYYQKINEMLKMQRSAGSPNEYVYNKETLGFRLDAKEEIAMYLNHEENCKQIDDFFDYTKALVTTLIDFQSNYHLHSDDWQRTVYIDTLGVSPIDFKISDDMKRELVKSGKLYTEAYLEWYNNDEAKANK